MGLMERWGPTTQALCQKPQGLGARHGEVHLLHHEETFFPFYLTNNELLRALIGSQDPNRLRRWDGVKRSTS